MKKEVIAVILLILLVNLINASYECSKGDFTKVRGEIERGRRSIINNLGLGISYSYEIVATRKYGSDIIIDALTLSLSNESSSESIKINNKDYDISLVKINGSFSNIRVGGSTGEIELENTNNIGGLVVYLKSAEGAYPGEGNVDLLVGLQKISLNEEEDTQKIVLNESEYLIKLFSASKENSNIDVMTCKEGNIVEIEDPQVVVSEAIPDNSSETNISDNNISEVEEVIPIMNTTEIINKTNRTTNQSSTLPADENKKRFYVVIIFSIIFLIFIILVIFILLKYKKGLIEKNDLNESRVVLKRKD